MLRRCICGDTTEDDTEVLMVEKLEHVKTQEQKKIEADNIAQEVEQIEDILVLDFSKIKATDLEEPERREACEKAQAVHMIYGKDQSFIKVTFPNVRVLFVEKCNKNFVYYNLHTSRFPKLYRLYCTSHPCEYDTMHRFQDNAGYIGYLEDCHYQHYLGRWWDDDVKHVQSISRDSIEDLLERYNKISV